MEIRKIELDGQQLFIPTYVQWEILFEQKHFQNKKFFIDESLMRTIRNSSGFKEVIYGLEVGKNKCNVYSLLQLKNELFRVHFESIICENCRYRPLISATPDVIDSYLGLTKEHLKRAKEKSNNLPNLSCSQCGHVNKRRTTIWQSNGTE